MNNYDKNRAYRILDKLFFAGNRDFINVDQYQTLKDFCLDIVANHDAPLNILPNLYTENSEFLRELISKAPQKINELYETMFFTYENFITTVQKPKILLARCSKSCQLNPKIKIDLMQLISAAEVSPI